MNKAERLKLVEKGTVEIVTKDGLEKLLMEKKCPTAYVGYEPSGHIHLGHMLSAVKLIELQKAGFKVIVLLADLHAHLNQKGTLEEIGEVARYNKECFIGLGLNPKTTRFILGSEIQLTKEYFLNVQRLALGTTLLRARRSMDVISREEKSPKVARVIYPLMQVIDMVALGVDVAVGGIDQRKIHMLARDNLPKMGFKSPLYIHLPLIHGLDGGDKMSSSKMNFISINDNPSEITKKINQAYCPSGVAKGNPIMEIFENLIFRGNERVLIKRKEKFGGDVEFESYKDMEKVYVANKVHPMDIKTACSSYLIEILAPVREHLKSAE